MVIRGFNDLCNETAKTIVDAGAKQSVSDTTHCSYQALSSQ